MSQPISLTYRGVSYITHQCSIQTVETQCFAKYRGLAYNIRRPQTLKRLQLEQV